MEEPGQFHLRELESREDRNGRTGPGPAAAPCWPPSLMPGSCFSVSGLQFVIDIYLSEFNGL